jgi:hypothetical protein
VSRSKKENNSNKKRVAYAIGSKKSRTRANNNLSLNGLSFGNSSFTMKNFNNNRAAESYAPSAAASAFVPKNEQRAFQIKMKKSISKQHAANKQRLANMSKRRSNGAKQAAVTRKANKEALLAAQAAAAAAMEEVREAQQVVVAQGQSSAGVSTHALQALAHAREAQRTALDEYTALQQALADLESTSSSSAANYANENNGSARANNGSASASAASSASSANFFRSFKP